MALDTRGKRPDSTTSPKRAARKRTAGPVALWRSTIGKKVIMATTGLFMIGFLAAHMVGNIKVFSGAEAFNSYSQWLRTLGEPILPPSAFLWIMRIALVVAVVAHIVSAVQLTRRNTQGQPKVRAKKRLGGTYVAFTMRSGGVILTLFVIWHILDFTTLTVNANALPGHPYENLVATFSSWYGNVIYLVALAAVGFHLWHGIWAAAQTLGVGTTRRNRAIRGFATLAAVGIAGGFALVPLAVMMGVVS
ncbi:MAG TPA: succinate dehydrogenase cytochrome b subunit [Candidatus Stackebrandtia excrementipullorum]|nr:succinate dehydrogenase cytochrome b subunit [Candidatus Stackebrandtia excrementipullorum]